MFSAKNEKDVVASWAVFGCRDYLLSVVCQNHLSKTKYQKCKHSQWAAFLNLENISFCWTGVNSLRNIFHTERMQLVFFAGSVDFRGHHLLEHKHSVIVVSCECTSSCSQELLAFTLKAEIVFYHCCSKSDMERQKQVLEAILVFSWWSSILSGTSGLEEFCMTKAVCWASQSPNRTTVVLQI